MLKTDQNNQQKIQEGTLVLLIWQGKIVPGLVVKGEKEDLEISLGEIDTGSTVAARSVVPVAQTDGSIKDPQKAFEKHLTEVIMNIGFLARQFLKISTVLRIQNATPSPEKREIKK